MFDVYTTVQGLAYISEADKARMYSDYCNYKKSGDEELEKIHKYLNII